MGRDKARLQLSGQSMFDRALAMMQSLFARVIIAGDRPDLSTPEVPAIADIYPGSALGGIHTGLVSAQTDWVMIAPCDMPYPDRGIAEALLQCRNGYDAVVPRTPSGFEPVFALYHKNCLPCMTDMLEQGNLRIYAFYQNINIRYLTAAEMPHGWQRSLCNLNTPEDLARARKQHR